MSNLIEKLHARLLRSPLKELALLERLRLYAPSPAYFVVAHQLEEA
ncbi:MAG: hypothetical protein GF398_04415 [Chitinivibrionales bacterium]|nr:hypothetical protein [Chitinivibrionales bacterium]